MQEHTKTGSVELSSLRSGMDRKTGRKYLRSGKMPSECRVEHKWRTRKDPFAAHWDVIRGKLLEAPELEGKALFEWLCVEYPESYHSGHLRTFQRRLRSWRALEGPGKEVYFPQIHKPGVRMETDFTHMNILGITISGQAFPHLLCHSVLCYSNWEWGTICHSESLMSLRSGIQAALFRLGHVPLEHWTDHSTAATHGIGVKEGQRDRCFNKSYLDMMAHYGMTPRTINVDSPHENGDVESLNGAFKRRMEQHLLLRGSRDFASIEEYRPFLESVLAKANQPRWKRLEEEFAQMAEIRVSPLPEYYEEEVAVSDWCTIKVAKKAYSVPSRMIREKVRTHRYDDRIEVYYKGTHQLTMPRLQGAAHHAINYRHIIDWLLRKPGAFENYRYREDLFPAMIFRWAYDRLAESVSSRIADMDYLRILSRAAQTMECEVAGALESIRQQGLLPRYNTVLEFLPQRQADIPQMPALVVDLEHYDRLLTSDEEVAHE